MKAALGKNTTKSDRNKRLISSLMHLRNYALTANSLSMQGSCIEFPTWDRRMLNGFGGGGGSFSTAAAAPPAGAAAATEIGGFGGQVFTPTVYIQLNSLHCVESSLIP